MLIFIKDNKIFVFIHIPKNSGSYIRNEIEKNKNNKVLKSFFDVSFGIDLAHIPFCLKNNYFKNDLNYEYFTFVRNPYNRLISAYFYKHPKNSIIEFKGFIKNTLQYILFNSYVAEYIHFYPQYKFLVNKYNDTNVNKEIKVFKIENYDNSYIKIDNVKIKNYNLSDYFDDETIKITDDIYRNDFIFFGYDFCVKN